MDLSDARSSDVEENGESSSRRKSGRAIRKPQLFSQDVSLITNIPEKRKRTTANEEGEDEDEEDAEEPESEDDPEDDDPDEEEERERRRAARRAANRRRQSGKSNTKPAPSRAAKKAKTNSAGKSLAIRPAANGKTKKAAPKKRTAPPRPIFHATSEGLFGKAHTVFLYHNRLTLTSMPRRYLRARKRYRGRGRGMVVRIRKRPCGGHARTFQPVPAMYRSRPFSGHRGCDR